jgi:hypothetical protein
LLRGEQPRLGGARWETIEPAGLNRGTKADKTIALGQREEHARMAAKEGYCVKCKAKKDIVDPQDITMKNGRPATQGTCPDCGTKIFKIGKS